MIRLVLIAALLAAWYFWYRWKKAPDNEAKRRLVNQFIMYGLLAGIMLLAAAGRIHWLGAVFAALLPILKLLAGWLFSLFPVLAKIYRNRAPAGSTGKTNRSHIKTGYLEMWLDHDSGNLGGTILQGEHQGSNLDDLDETLLRELFAEYQRIDSDSARLLQSYLQRRFEQFEEQANGDEPHSDNAHSSSAMSPAEAREILGVEEQADRAEIRRAHRKLMQKLHPDHGGNDYFAAKVNQARDLLLGRLQD